MFNRKEGIHLECQFEKKEFTVGSVKVYLQASNPEKVTGEQMEKNNQIQEHVDPKVPVPRHRTEEEKLRELNRESELMIDGMLNALPAIDRERNFFYRLRAQVHDASCLPLLFHPQDRKFYKPSVYLEMGLKKVKQQLDLQGINSSVSAHKHKSRNPVFNWEQTFTVFENKVENLLSNRVFFLTIFEFKKKQKLGHIEIPLKHLLNFRPVHFECHLVEWVNRQISNSAENRMQPMETLESNLDEEEMAKSNLLLLTKKAAKNLEQGESLVAETGEVQKLECPRIRFSLILESPLGNMNHYIGESHDLENVSKLTKTNKMAESLVESIYAEPEKQMDLLEIVVRDVESARKREFWPGQLDLMRLGLSFGRVADTSINWAGVHDKMNTKEMGRVTDHYNALYKSTPVFLSKFFKKDAVKMDIFYKALAVFTVPKDVFRLGTAKIFLQVWGEATEAGVQDAPFLNRRFGGNSGLFDISLKHGVFEFQRKNNENQKSTESQNRKKDSKQKNKGEELDLFIKEEGKEKQRHKLDEKDILKDMEIVPQYITKFSLDNLQEHYNSPTNKLSTNKIAPFIKKKTKYQLADPEQHLNYFDLAQKIQLKMHRTERTGLPCLTGGWTKDIQELVWRVSELDFPEEAEETNKDSIWESIEEEEKAKQGNILETFMQQGGLNQRGDEAKNKKLGRVRKRWVANVNCFKLLFKWNPTEGVSGELQRMDLWAVLGVFGLKLTRETKQKQPEKTTRFEGNLKNPKEAKQYRDLIKKNMLMLEKLGNVGDTWRVLSREISQKNDMINRLAGEVRKQEDTLKETCREIEELRREVSLVDRQRELVERKLKAEEELSVKGLLDVEVEHLGEEELKIKLMRVAKLYETERKVNQYYEGMMRQTLQDLGKVGDLEKEFEDLQQKQREGARELLYLQEEAGKVDLYQETMVRQEKNIVLLEKLLEECISEAEVGTGLAEEIEEVRVEVGKLKTEVGQLEKREENGWGQEMEEEERQLDRKLESLAKEKYQLERNLLEKRPVLRKGESSRKREEELKNQIFQSRLRVRELEEELKQISTDYVDQMETLKGEFGDDPVFRSPGVGSLEMRRGETQELMQDGIEMKRGETRELVQDVGFQFDVNRSKMFLEKKLRAFSKDLKDARKIIDNEQKENFGGGNVRASGVREMPKRGASGLDLLFTKEEQERFFKK